MRLCLSFILASTMLVPSSSLHGMAYVKSSCSAYKKMWVERPFQAVCMTWSAACCALVPLAFYNDYVGKTRALKEKKDEESVAAKKIEEDKANAHRNFSESFSVLQKATQGNNAQSVQAALQEYGKHAANDYISQDDRKAKTERLQQMTIKAAQQGNEALVTVLLDHDSGSSVPDANVFYDMVFSQAFNNHHLGLARKILNHRLMEFNNDNGHYYRLLVCRTLSIQQILFLLNVQGRSGQQLHDFFANIILPDMTFNEIAILLQKLESASFTVNEMVGNETLGQLILQHVPNQLVGPITHLLLERGLDPMGPCKQDKQEFDTIMHRVVNDKRKHDQQELGWNKPPKGSMSRIDTIVSTLHLHNAEIVKRLTQVRPNGVYAFRWGAEQVIAEYLSYAPDAKILPQEVQDAIEGQKKCDKDGQEYVEFMDMSARRKILEKYVWRGGNVSRLMAYVSCYNSELQAVFDSFISKPEFDYLREYHARNHLMNPREEEEIWWRESRKRYSKKEEAELEKAIDKAEGELKNRHAQQQALLAAIESGDTEKAQANVTYYTINSRDGNNKTPLHHAVLFKWPEMVKLLLKHWDVIQRGRYSVDAFIADVTLKDYAGKTALDYAREGRDKTIIELLERAVKDPLCIFWQSRTCERSSYQRD